MQVSDDAALSTYIHRRMAGERDGEVKRPVLR